MERVVVAVVARLARIDDRVAAGLDLAARIAAIRGRRVVVVALLAGVGIEHVVTAGGDLEAVLPAATAVGAAAQGRIPWIADLAGIEVAVAAQRPDTHATETEPDV